MLATPSSRIAPVFQQQLPVDLPELVVQRVVAEEKSSRSGRRTDPRKFSFGLLPLLCPAQLVDKVLAECGRQEKRCRLLPARLTVYALLLMCLQADLSYAKLMQRLACLAPGRSWRAPDRSAFVGARKRLGWEVMAALFGALARPLGRRERDECCFWRGYRVMAVDGTTMALPRNPELESAFGGQRGHGRSGHRVGPPRLRLVALVECGARALLDVAFGHYDTGENTLTQTLVRSLEPGMLVLADRGFASKPLWEACLGTGADLLWRAKRRIGRRRLQRLPDGTYLVAFGTGKPVTVRVIEYQVLGSRQVYRLLTSLLNPATAPALHLAQLYTQRWEIETVTRELKVGQCEDGSLRSHSELGVRQELWSTCLAHVLIRKFAFQVAQAAPDTDPDRISFSLVQNAISDSVGRLLTNSRLFLLKACQALLDQLGAVRNLNLNRLRSCPRARHPASSRYPHPARSHPTSPAPKLPAEIVLFQP